MTCPHNMPNPKTCFDCMEEGNLEPVKWKRAGYTFAAKFRGMCADPTCKDKEFNQGDEIQRWDKEDRETKYTHAWGCKL